MRPRCHFRVASHARLGGARLRGRVAVALGVLSAFAAAPAIAAGAWTYDTRSSGSSTVHVARYALSPNRDVHLGLACGGSGGVAMQVGIGDPDIAARALSGPSPAGVTFTFVKRNGLANTVGVSAFDEQSTLTSQGMAGQPPGGVPTVQIEGSDAAEIAQRMEGDWDEVEVQEGETRVAFSLAGAADAIGQVVANCPDWPR